MDLQIPERFKERYVPLVDDPESFLSSLLRYLPKTFRVNTLKASSADIASRFRGYGIAVRQMPWYEDAFLSESLDAGSTIEHFTGSIYMQEFVSMLPPLLLRKELAAARFVLDGCAAPGSKTTQLAALMGNRGTIVANDIDYSRIRALKFNIEKTGTLNAVITNRDLRSFPQMQFDAIILDAPCSAEGTMRKNAELFSVWSEREIEKHSRIQKQLIEKAFDLLAPGGSMVYSTCTFAPEENEAVVDHLLRNRPAETERISIDGFRTSPALEAWSGTEFDTRVRDSARIWPHHNDSGGFFLAKVTK
ncbi:MAG: NOL1/NOP2/sun family putative RNA methylase [Candidatus Micrarchaeia archaeon]